MSRPFPGNAPVRGCDALAVAQAPIRTAYGIDETVVTTKEDHGPMQGRSEAYGAFGVMRPVFLSSGEIEGEHLIFARTAHVHGRTIDGHVVHEVERHPIGQVLDLVVTIEFRRSGPRRFGLAREAMGPEVFGLSGHRTPGHAAARRVLLVSGPVLFLSRSDRGHHTAQADQGVRKCCGSHDVSSSKTFSRAAARVSVTVCGTRSPRVACSSNLRN